MNFKMTPLEKKWVLYDVGNSAFTMLVSTIFPIYFNYLAENAILHLYPAGGTDGADPGSRSRYEGF